MTENDESRVACAGTRQELKGRNQDDHIENALENIRMDSFTMPCRKPSSVGLGSVGKRIWPNSL
jgi:hypothetical protein